MYNLIYKYIDNATNTVRTKKIRKLLGQTVYTVREKFYFIYRRVCMCVYIHTCVYIYVYRCSTFTL